MPSVAAVLSRSQVEPVETVRRMLAAAPYRGMEQQVILCGRCLIGVATDGEDHHTGTAADGEIAVAFSGRLDNFADLVRTVRANGPAKHSETPAEVVLAAWRLWGEETPIWLRGSFAVIVTNGVRLWAFRDHVGNGLLFFHDGAPAFYAATEVKQVMAGAQILRDPDVDALEEYFLVGGPADRAATWFKRVKRVLIASLLTADADGTASRRYWDPTPILETLRPNDEQFATEFDQLMTQAIDRVQDGRTVISLSGGIDSATVAAFAAPLQKTQGRAPIAALSAVYPDWPTVDESAHIHIIADALGLDLYTYQPTANPFQGLREWAEILDGPIPRLIAIHEVAEYYSKAKSLGFRTILSGDFAESLNDSRGYLGPHLVHRGRFRAAFQHYRQRRTGGASWRGIVREVAASVTPRFLDEAHHRRKLQEFALMDWMDERVVKRMMAAQRSDTWLPRGDRWRAAQVGWLNTSAVGYEAIETCQAFCGVRRREPWADVDLFEYFLKLPAEVRFVVGDPRPKALIRRVLRGRLPDSIVDRVDKPRFGDYYTARVDYDVLRRWLIKPEYRVRGIRYDVVADHLERRDLSMRGYMWLRDLAALHAFMSLW